VSVLTPPGTGAIATVAVAGPRAWGLARWLFRPAGTKPLPESPELHRFWFGTLGEGAGDEVILAVKQIEPEVAIEVHCHGGRRVVRWVIEQFTGERRGVSPACVEQQGTSGLRPDARLLPLAPTLRTASVLLDQYHGAFDRAAGAILAHLDAGNLEDARRELGQLAALAPVGRHLVVPWKVVVAGPPNVGKSSLVNALAGYQRAVVSEVAGTTRDVVTTAVAFDGWPVELADTAGLRDAAGLEAAGVERAKQVLASADVVVWVSDSDEWEHSYPDPETAGVVTLPNHHWVLVRNKIDLGLEIPQDCTPKPLYVSALTSEGVPGLASWIARRLVPNPPPAGAAVPFTLQIADAVESALAALAEGRTADATGILRATVAPA
jgi:tRNA modification GTPase